MFDISLSEKTFLVFKFELVFLLIEIYFINIFPQGTSLSKSLFVMAAINGKFIELRSFPLGRSLGLIDNHLIEQPNSCKINQMMVFIGFS